MFLHKVWLSGAVGCFEKHSKEFRCSETVFAAFSPEPKFSVGFLELGWSEAVCHSTVEGP